MSLIDCYRKELLGVVTCPADYEIVAYNNSHRDIPIYRVLQDIELANELEAKAGDVILGGGSGETPAFRLSVPRVIEWFTSDKVEDFQLADLFCAYWSFNDAYVFGTGYIKLGWTVNVDLRMWLAEHLVAFLVKEYSEYRNSVGNDELDEDGSICRLPTAKDIAGWTPDSTP